TSIVNRDSGDIYLYNMGVTGASPAQYYQITRTAGIQKGSNIIIVFFLGNDSLQLLDESGYLPAIALTEEGSVYEIIKPVKEIMPRLAISSPLANLLYTWNLDRRTKDKIFDKDSQGEGSYRFFCDNPKQFNEAGRRFSFLLDHFRKDFNVSIVFLGNFLMSSDGAFGKKEHFHEQFTRLSKIAEDNGITSTLHIPKPGELDATFHPNVQGNLSFSKHLKEHVRSLLDNQSK
ncbi:hypothetical protein KAR04_09040, partial [Candidatus Calescamantes bacterium]|nr:hypothetical protein [Candidatus Calescamantes bacterium]